MTINDKTIDTCNSLLRGEIAAIETYTQAIDTFTNSSDDSALERIRTAHIASAAELRKFISQDGAEPASGSGLWGGFAQTLEGAATLIGESPALKILQAGEEHGISEYMDAMNDLDISEASKELIRHTLLPPLTQHLVELQARRERVA